MNGTCHRKRREERSESFEFLFLFLFLSVGFACSSCLFFFFLFYQQCRFCYFSWCFTNETTYIIIPCGLLSVQMPQPIEQSKALQAKKIKIKTTKKDSVTRMISDYLGNPFSVVKALIYTGNNGESIPRVIVEFT